MAHCLRIYPFCLAAMLSVAVLCLPGCGQKGPLYLPDETRQQDGK